jgi:DNA-binding CsgD family transcriptional regulator
MSERLLIIIAVLLQLIGCVFFAGQIVIAPFGLTLRPVPWQMYEVLEMMAALALGLGVVIGVILMRRTQRMRARAELALRHASAAFGDVIAERFETWGLSKAEQDVAMFLIKGSSTAEIAQMRMTSEGTIKAQNAAIYRKAGVTGKTQLLSLFIEELFADDTEG